MNKVVEKVKEWLQAQNLEFTVQAETFIIDGDGPKPFKFVPMYIIVGKRITGKVIIVEPVTSFAPQGGLKRVQTFRRQFHEKYHVVVITKKRMLDRIPSNAYDQLIVFEDIDKAKVKLRAIAK
jgi:uncharacterized protein YifN (PemK superfamily)